MPVRSRKVRLLSPIRIATRSDGGCDGGSAMNVQPNPFFCARRVDACWIAHVETKWLRLVPMKPKAQMVNESKTTVAA